jgi:glycyl-tRNA synthetase
MAHYACDCWDAEVETSNGWVEMVGHANRSAYDLEQHSKGSGKSLVAARILKEPKQVTITDMELNKQLIGKTFKGK